VEEHPIAHSSEGEEDHYAGESHPTQRMIRTIDDSMRYTEIDLPPILIRFPYSDVILLATSGSALRVDKSSNKSKCLIIA
jgi:hypothetical protein